MQQLSPLSASLSTHIHTRACFCLLYSFDVICHCHVCLCFFGTNSFFECFNVFCLNLLYGSTHWQSLFAFSSSKYNLIIVSGVRGHSWVPWRLFISKMEEKGCRCLKWTSLSFVPKFRKFFITLEFKGFGAVYFLICISCNIIDLLSVHYAWWLIVI